MQIAVIGLWHLGTVTAACLARAGFDVVAYDKNIETISALKNNRAPLFEPGLNELLSQTHIKFTSNLSDINNCAIVWITYDTPVDENDQADIEYVKNSISEIFPFVKTEALILISSQIPVGSTKQISQLFSQQYPQNKVNFAYSPENLRLGKSIEIFSNPDRIVVGVENEVSKKILLPVLEKFSSNIIWMSIESAEMTKHALNSFLAISVTFANELASLCELVAGASAAEVEQGLKSESRIGPRAYLRAGNAFAGGTLARDVNFLINIGAMYNSPTPLFNAILTSNQQHKKWLQRKINQTMGNLTDKTFAILGLTYKADTDTLRRSETILLCRWLAEAGAKIKAYDPTIKQLDAELSQFIDLKNSALQALQDSHAVVISTESPEFSELIIEDFLNNLVTPYIFDANGFLQKNIKSHHNVHYMTVGKSI